MEALALDLQGPADRPRDHPRRPRGLQRAQDLRPAARVAARDAGRGRDAARQVPRRRRLAGCTSCVHLARAGWIRWRDEVPDLPARPNSKSPLAARIVLDEDDEGRTTGLDVTEAGTKKSLAIYVVRDPLDVEGIARLGPDPLDDAFTIEVLGADPRRRRPVPDQGRAAPPGHHRRHRQRLLRRAPARRADVPVQARQRPRPTPSSRRCTTPIRTVLGDAVDRSRGLATSELKGEKKSHLAVHGRTGRDVSGLRRHRARGQLRRLQPAVLPDLPDRRQAARRPADVAPAQVARHEPAPPVPRLRTSPKSAGGTVQRDPQPGQVGRAAAPRPPPGRPGAG